MIQSNFANKPPRNTRRDKFMAGLLAVYRRIPIAPLGGSDLPLKSFIERFHLQQGSWTGTGQCCVSCCGRAVGAGFSTVMPEGMTSAAQNLVQAMMDRRSGRRVRIGDAVETGVGRGTDGSFDEILLQPH